MAPTFCENGFSGRMLLEENQSLVITVINIIMMPCTLVANFLVIYGLYRTRQLGSIINKFFLCLSISDCCIAAIVQTHVAILFMAYRSERQCELEMSAQFMTFLFGHFSGFTIVVIGIDRYIHMKYLQRYDSIMTKLRAKIFMVFSVTGAITMGTAYTISTMYGVYQHANLIILVADLLAIVIVYIAYIEAYIKVKEHVKKTSNVRKTANAPSYAIAMITTILLILGAVFLCYVPYVIVGVLGYYQVQVNKQELSSNLAFGIYLTYLLVYLNSCLNATIFIYKNEPVRNFILNKLSRTRDARKSTQGNSTDSIQLSTLTNLKLKVTGINCTDSTVDLLSLKSRDSR